MLIIRYSKPNIPIQSSRYTLHKLGQHIHSYRGLYDYPF